MIQSNNISKEHSINSILPDYYIHLPLKENESFEEKDVTCFFSTFAAPFQLRCVDVKYFESINNKILSEQELGEIVYVFKGKPFDIENEKKRLCHL